MKIKIIWILKILKFILSFFDNEQDTQPEILEKNKREDNSKSR
jgi:hypothetical protein